MLCLRSVLRVRPRAISVPLTWNCTELAALDAICRGLSICNYVRERFRIPLSPPFFQQLAGNETRLKLSYCFVRANWTTSSELGPSHPSPHPHKYSWLS